MVTDSCGVFKHGRRATKLKSAIWVRLCTGRRLLGWFSRIAAMQTKICTQSLCTCRRRTCQPNLAPVPPAQRVPLSDEVEGQWHVTTPACDNSSPLHLALLSRHGILITTGNCRLACTMWRGRIYTCSSQRARHKRCVSADPDMANARATSS